MMRPIFSRTSVALVLSVAFFSSVLAGPATRIPPSITSQPVSQTVTAGQKATFSVVATGTNPLKYHWSKNGVSITGATSASYTTPATTTSDSGSQFTVAVSNSAGSVTSNAATLTVNALVAPSITTQPASQTVTAGQAATFSVVATGTSPLNYQWRKNGVSITGATSASYATPATTTSDSGSQFTAVVSNSAGSVTSNAATLTVTVPGPLSANLSNINFANVSLGSSSSVPVQLLNSGTASISISGILISGPGFAMNGISTGQILLPGQTTSMTVTFAPTATGAVAGSITIASNAVNSPTTISMSGTGVQLNSHSMDLSWGASASSVIGYNVYRADTSGGPYAILNSSPVSTTQYVDLTVQAGQTYFYVVTALDSSNTESAYSNEALATIPTP